jgi:hypothetical protein
MNIVITTGELERTDNNTLNYRKVRVRNQLYHLLLRIVCTFLCNLQIQVQTHAVLVIDLYELLGNPTN